MKATAVIGANWGDEGKGLLTDFHSDPDTIVVRYNGGAQAGHTVVRAGKRHVFQHFGSGSLRGARTFLSRFFLNNPILYFQELEILRSLGCEPKVYTETGGLVTTPWDMMINQVIEESRGTARHGSCGVGINETIKRSEVPDFLITVDDLENTEQLARKCETILWKWVPSRLKQLDIEASSKWMDMMLSSNVFDTFMEYCAAYRGEVEKISRLRSVIDCWDAKNIVFEGAQGLLLDEDHYFFPHVTHSHTGLKNVVTLATEAGLDHLDVIYATRAYATRHGAGPFPREVKNLRYEDQTNVPNDWQGSLRSGHLDLDLLGESILNDIRYGSLPITRGLAITCLDQVVDNVGFWHDGRLCAGRDELIRLARQKINATRWLLSHGPTASDVSSHAV
jgi:adenylosuccinate synthase